MSSSAVVFISESEISTSVIVPLNTAAIPPAPALEFMVTSAAVTPSIDEPYPDTAITPPTHELLLEELKVTSFNVIFSPLNHPNDVIPPTWPAALIVVPPLTPEFVTLISHGPSISATIPANPPAYPLGFVRVEPITFEFVTSISGTYPINPPTGLINSSSESLNNTVVLFKVESLTVSLFLHFRFEELFRYYL